jgi:molybdopterin-guanine dinucleotide biosynthesis protein A
MEFDVTCAILAGGESRRMGQDKAFIRVEGMCLFDYVYNKCKELFSEIIIVTKQPQQYRDYQAHIVIDAIGRGGSLGGIYTALMKATNYHTFCVACDMPFLMPEIVTHLIKKRLNRDIVIPLTKGGLEPLHALYSKQCIEPIKKLLERGERKIIKLLSGIYGHEHIGCPLLYCRLCNTHRIEHTPKSCFTLPNKTEYESHLSEYH